MTTLILLQIHVDFAFTYMCAFYLELLYSKENASSTIRENEKERRKFVNGKKTMLRGFIFLFHSSIIFFIVFLPTYKVKRRIFLSIQHQTTCPPHHVRNVSDKIIM